ncbi:unnamed protein product [Dibothriocephalus latus]|uniref:Uncharacterized protein n=1 Tax=Dibothriocephalus latus TaxID=60516 RepID=A0A3P6TCW8_DIBLA|nr:unnamed protein product [Dibothriocephalus latus]
MRLNLNDCANLDLPHADDSDASEKENAELEEWRSSRQDATSVTRFGSIGDGLFDSLKSKTTFPVLSMNVSTSHLPPPPPPPSTACVIPVTDARTASSAKPPTGPGRPDSVCISKFGPTVRSRAPSLGLRTSSLDSNSKVQTPQGKKLPSWETMDAKFPGDDKSRLYTKRQIAFFTAE